MKTKILLINDSAPGLPAATALTSATAGQTLDGLKTALTSADATLQGLLKDPHFANCPFLAPIRSGVLNGALSRFEHLEKWLAANPVPAPAAATANQ